MVDFGFGPLLDKFEQHYGRLPTKILIGLVGGAVAATCLGVIWSFISPIVGWGTETATGSSVVWMVWNIVRYAVALCFLLGGALTLASVVHMRRIIKETEDAYLDAAHILEESAQISKGTSNVLEMSRAALKSIESASDAIGLEMISLSDAMNIGIDGAERNAEKMEKSAARMRELSSRARKIT